MKIVSDELMDSLLVKAAESPRKRTNWNLHTEMSDPVHRFCIAALPGTVVPPHRHPGKWELTVMLRGRITVETFHLDGTPADKVELSANGPVKVLELDDQVYHCFTALEPSVFLEIKKGPYEPGEDMKR